MSCDQEEKKYCMELKNDKHKLFNFFNDFKV